MGVPGLLGWLNSINKTKDSQADIYRNVKNSEEIAAYFVDMNSVLHDVAKIMPTFDLDGDDITEYGTAVVTALSTMLAKIKKPHNLVLCVDGAPPIAKLVDQRNRRYRSAATPPVYEASFHISVGTRFMYKLNSFLEQWIRNGGRNGDGLPLANTIIYSNHLVPGEGEFKIFELIRKGEIKDRGFFIIQGADADLLIISVALFNATNNEILLHRPQQKKPHGFGGKQRGIGDFISGRALMELATKPLPFVLCLSFVGNDFIPTIPTTPAIPSVLDLILATSKKDVYKNIIDHKTGEINWSTLSILLSEMGGKEEVFLNDRTKYENFLVEGGKPKPQQQQTLFEEQDPTKKHQLLPGLEQKTYENFRTVWYKSGFSVTGSVTVSDNIIIDMCRCWLRMLQWCMRYYITGVHTEEYYPYRIAPTLRDLAAYIQRVQNPKVEFGTPMVDRYPDPIHPLAQLACIIPPAYSHIIPDQLLSLVVNDKTVSAFSDLLPKNVDIDRRGVFPKKDHTAKPILPPPDFNRWRDLVIILKKPPLFETLIKNENILGIRIEPRLIVNPEFTVEESFDEILKESKM